MTFFIWGCLGIADVALARVGSLHYENSCHLLLSEKQPLIASRSSVYSKAPNLFIVQSQLLHELNRLQSQVEANHAGPNFIDSLQWLESLSRDLILLGIEANLMMVRSQIAITLQMVERVSTYFAMEAERSLSTMNGLLSSSVGKINTKESIAAARGRLAEIIVANSTEEKLWVRTKVGVWADKFLPGGRQHLTAEEQELEIDVVFNGGYSWGEVKLNSHYSGLLSTSWGRHLKQMGRLAELRKKINTILPPDRQLLAPHFFIVGEFAPEVRAQFDSVDVVVHDNLDLHSLRLTRE